MNQKILAAVIVLAAAGFVVIGGGWKHDGGAVPGVSRTDGGAVLATPAAMPAIQTAAAPMEMAAPLEVGPVGDPVAPNYMSDRLRLFEAHWQGMDGRLMTRELARKLGYPLDSTGVLLGEVTLQAARSGLRGGDIVVKVADIPVRNIEEFQAVTKDLMNRTEAKITVLRKDAKSAQALRALSIVLRGDGILGFAQVEGAPQILAGDPRPHSARGPCTTCHPIGKGFELTPDPDLISLPPPVIAREVATREVPPHENSGPCEACHVVR
jgi:hypothetical protein